MVREYDTLSNSAEARAYAQSEESLYRRARAREALLLVIHLHEARIVSYSVNHEVLCLMRQLVPDDVPSWERSYTALIINFVREYVLTGWHPLGTDDKLRGNDADDHLLDYAEQHGLPLVTGEGYWRDGTLNDRKPKGGLSLRGRANARGVPVFAPREYYAGKLDETVAIEEFLAAFERRGPDYLGTLTDDRVHRHALDTMLGYLRYVLLGELEGCEPLPVKFEP